MSIEATVFIPGPGQLTRCRGCSELIFFATSRDGKSMPVDHKPCNDGNLAIAPVMRGEKLPRATVIRPAQAAGMHAAGVPVYSPHWARCPKAEEFRKRARAAGARKRGGRR